MAIACTLLSDGSSDKMLEGPLRWLLEHHFPDTAFDLSHADLRGLHVDQTDFPARICCALELFPCQVLFLHRDAERESWDTRKKEIQAAVSGSNCTMPDMIVPVVPVRMTEAWFLISKDAIRSAAGNPNGKIQLDLPNVTRLESLPDPKLELKNLLERASELNPRRLRKFHPLKRMHNLADHIEDFAPLRRLKSFSELESAIRDLPIGK